MCRELAKRLPPRMLARSSTVACPRQSSRSSRPSRWRWTRSRSSRRASRTKPSCSTGSPRAPRGRPGSIRLPYRVHTEHVVLSHPYAPPRIPQMEEFRGQVVAMSIHERLQAVDRFQQRRPWLAFVGRSSRSSGTTRPSAAGRPGCLLRLHLDLPAAARLRHDPRLRPPQPSRIRGDDPARDPGAVPDPLGPAPPPLAFRERHRARHRPRTDAPLRTGLHERRPERLQRHLERAPQASTQLPHQLACADLSCSPSSEPSTSSPRLSRASSARARTDPPRTSAGSSWPSWSTWFSLARPSGS